MEEGTLVQGGQHVEVDLDPNDDENDDDLTPLPSFDPNIVIPQGNNFLRVYYEEAEKHPTPNEFHLFLGLQALGLVVSRRVKLSDFDDVLGNMALVLLGSSTAGKSRALKPISQDILQHDDSKLAWGVNEYDEPQGVKYISSPGSGEYLIEVFDYKTPDTELTDSKGKVIATTPGRPCAVTGLVYYNELSVLSAKSNGPNSAYKGILMDFIDGANRIEAGTRTRGELCAHKPFASFLTTTQPKDLKNTLTKSDIARGLVNRFLFIGGTSKKQKSIGKYKLDWEPSRRLLEDVHEWSKQISLDAPNGVFAIDDWDQDALDLYDKFYHKTIEPTKEHDDSGVLGRIDLHVKRLILLFAINEKSTTIKLNHVESTLGLFDYLLECYGVVAGKVVSSDLSDAMDKIMTRIKKLEALNKPCTEREINTRSCKLPSDVWADAIGRMLRIGMVYRNVAVGGRKDGRGGRTTETYNTYKTSRPQKEE